MYLWIFSILILITLLGRVWAILPSGYKHDRTRRTRSTVKLAVFLGSGGHTSEALSLLSAVDFERYTPRIYVISEGDALSAQKASNLESRKAFEKNQYTTLTVPRARKVHQPLLTTPFSAFRSLLTCLYHVTLLAILGDPFADVLIVNGPGTCFTLCLPVILNKILGLKAPQVIYIESFARVKRLSLSGKLLRYIADRFIVQWPTLLKDGKRGECRGWLV
ncbi:UDP-N-acetylglucosamine transferase subunit [Marasmius tenuissimus]|nr:UDP-N-acetylglucosamine transferase subunit [Marasmius tenuissimus]